MTPSMTTGDGCKIAYRFDGAKNAPILMLSNSLGTDHSMWDPQMDAFTQHFRVLRYDSRGHGSSGVPAGGYSLDRLGRDIIELLDVLNIDDVDFCGLSLGGMMGQWLGIYAPERVRSLILANTSSYMGPPSGWDQRIDLVNTQGMACLATSSAERWFTDEFRDCRAREIQPIIRTFLATHAAGYAGCCAAIRDMDMRRSICLVKRPTLVIGGSRDPSTPPAHSEAIAATILGAQLHMLDAAHLSNVEASAEFSAAVLMFLDAVSSG